MTQALLVTLSDTVYQHLQQISTMTKQLLEQLVRQSIEGNLPPAISNASPEIQQELLTMQLLSAKELRQIAESQISTEQQARHVKLLEKNSTNRISGIVPHLT